MEASACFELFCRTASLFVGVVAVSWLSGSKLMDSLTRAVFLEASFVSKLGKTARWGNVDKGAIKRKG